MKNRFRILLIMAAVLMIFGIRASAAAADGGGQYCATPPFVQANLPSNIMLVLDYSGSMSWYAYPGMTSPTPGVTYYGYFIPDKFYKKVSGIWEETAGPENHKKGIFSGNFLNWYYMTRIDILRWILTGGKISSDGSSLVTSLGEYILKQDASSYNSVTGSTEGILQKIEARNQKPRIGASFFGSGNTGDVFKRVGLSYDYVTLISAINNTSPNGNTGTYYAVNEMEKLYSEDATTISDYGSQDPYKYNNETVSCVKNFVLLMSDGEWNEPDYSTNSDPIRAINDMWQGGQADLVSSLSGDQNAETYTVSMFSDPADPGTNALKWMAVYGNYDDKDNNAYPCSQSSYPNTSLTVTEDGNLNLGCTEIKPNANDTGPYGYFEGKDANELKTSITTTFNEILKKISSGSAASVVSTRGKAGANIIQALFFPKKVFSSGTEISWTGDLKNFWYYVGPYAQNIREDNDTSGDTSGPTLDLAKDYIMEFDSSDPTKVNLFADTNGNGTPDTSEGQVSIDQTAPVWDAGEQLFSQPDTSRTIFTTISSTYTSTPFTSANSSSLMAYLDTSSVTSAADLINYIRGADSSQFRSRTVTIGSTTGVYKLGDIVYSTPKIVSSIPIGSYYKDYDDSTYKAFINSDTYKNRMGIVVVGANDGMLHAFKLGRPTVLSAQGSKIFMLDRYEADGTLGKPLGAELWAYIPENILPYLKYYADPNYCHLYYVDLTPTVVDASVYDSSSASYDNTADDVKTKDSWRTILIGGLRLGGACGNGTGGISPPSYAGKPTGLGRSSYFALDVTDTEHPKLLWEFTDNDLAFSTTGPAVIHIPAKKTDTNGNQVDDNSKNGHWYVVFASGPDKYDGTVHQPLFLYALDLGTGKLEQKWQLSGNGGSPLSSITNAFAGRLTNGVIDLGENYSDDALYFGYNYKQGSNWNGGVLRLITDDKTPTNWQISKLIDGIGPVTASTSVLQDTQNSKLWVFFGTGRYFTASDDSDVQRNLYGVIDPCYPNTDTSDPLKKFSSSCTSVTASSLTDVTSDPAAMLDVNAGGWKIDLDQSTSSANAERVISDPVISSDGTLLFATTAPTSDICSYGGNSYVWELNYSNGGAVSDVTSALIQTSTGAITKVSKSDFSGSNSKGGRRINKAIAGAAPPTSSITVINSPSPVNRFIHWYER